MHFFHLQHFSPRPCQNPEAHHAKKDESRDNILGNPGQRACDATNENTFTNPVDLVKSPVHHVEKESATLKVEPVRIQIDTPDLGRLETG